MNADPKAFLGRGWTYPVQPNASNTDAALAAYEQDVREAVRIILETNRGERVMRPDFGAGLHDFLFEPLNTTTLALIRHRVEESLITWEPRIRLELIDVQLADGPRNRIDITIEYTVRATNTFYNLVYPFYLQEGDQR
jgi:Bacteriophage baseplate protein W